MRKRRTAFFANKRNTHTKSKSKRVRLIMCIIIVSIIMSLFYDVTSPIIRKVTEIKCKSIVIEEMSAECLKLIDNMNIKYTDIVKMEYDESGRISAIATDSMKINFIKFKLEESVTRAINAIASREYKIPLGTLLDSEFLAGRGPEIAMKIYQKGHLSADINSEFISFGINQTAHRIFLELSVEVIASLPLNSKNTAVNTNFLLAETTIVGDIPQYYTDISSGSNNNLGDIKDDIINRNVY